MKLNVTAQITFSADKLARVALAGTERLKLDLYCVAPGQAQKPHTHQAEDKVYYVVKGAGRFSLAGREETLGEGDMLLAPAGTEHGLVNDGPNPLVVLVAVAPPPRH